MKIRPFIAKPDCMDAVFIDYFLSQGLKTAGGKAGLQAAMCTGLSLSKR